LGVRDESAVRAEYTVLAAWGLGFVRYTGGIGARAIIRLAGALWADPDWDAEFDLVVDLAGARMTMGEEERRRMASFFESYPLASRGRLVHIVGDGSLEYSRMSEAILPGGERSFARVPDLGEALRQLYGERAPEVEAALRASPLRRVSLD